MEALGARLAAAREMLGDALHDSRAALAEQGSQRLDGARALGLEAWQGAQRGSRAAGRAMAGHPWETLLLAGAAGIAVGWIVRHAWRSGPASASKASRAPRRATRAGNAKPASRKR
jgi:hypothetical protein